MNIQMLKRRLLTIEGGVALVTLVGAFLRLKGLTAQSLWYDELGSVYSTLSRGLSEIIGFCQSDFHPPLYFLLLRLWELLFGGGELALRSFSALAGIAGIPAVYFLGRELFSKTAGLFAAALTALNIFHIAYSQEVRSYSLLFLLSVLSFLAFTKLIRNPGFRPALAYAAAVTLLIYTHYFGLFVFASQIIIVLFLLPERKLRLPLIKNAGLAGLAIGVLYLPWVKSVLKITQVTSFWTSRPAANFFLDYFKSFLGFEPLLIVLFTGLLLLYLAAPHVPEWFPSHKLLLLSWMIVPLLIPYGRSFGHPSPLTDRNAIVILPAIILAVAAALSTISEKRARAFLCSVLIVMSGMSIRFTRGNYYQNPVKQGWRDIARYVVEADPEKKYPVFAHPFFDYYLNHVFGSGRKIDRAGDAAEMNRRIKDEAFPGVWILEGHVENPEKAARLESLDRTLVKATALSVRNVHAALFVRPNELEVLQGRHLLPLTLFASERPPQKQAEDIIIAPWNIRLSTPEMRMSPGQYRIRVNARGTEAFGSFARIRLSLHRTEEVFELGPSDQDYLMTVDVEEPGTYRLVLEFDNDAFDEAAQKDRNVWINAVEIRTSGTT